MAAGASLRSGGRCGHTPSQLRPDHPQWLNTSSHSTAPSRCYGASSSSWSTSRPLRQVGQLSPWSLKHVCSPSWEVTASALMQLLVPSGGSPYNHEILREAHCALYYLSVLSTDKFKTDFYDVSARLRMGRWGSCCLLHAGYDRLLFPGHMVGDPELLGNFVFFCPLTAMQ